MLQRTLLLFLFILGAYFPHSQQRYKEQHWLSLYHKAEALYSNSSATDQTDSIALSLYKQVIELLSKNGEADTVLLDAYLKTGILSMSHGQSNEAIEFFHDAIRAKIKHPLLGDTLLFKPYHRITILQSCVITIQLQE